MEERQIWSASGGDEIQPMVSENAGRQGCRSWIQILYLLRTWNVPLIGLGCSHGLGDPGLYDCGS